MHSGRGEPPLRREAQRAFQTSRHRNQVGVTAPFCWLVDHDEIRIPHHGSANRQHLLLPARQAANVDALKAASAEFTAMRRLAMRFRGLLRGGTAEGLDAWLIDARASGISAMQRFAKTIRQDLEAVRNAMPKPWSNGQTEGQINRLKTLKRAMYGRAGVELLRARMMPL